MLTSPLPKGRRGGRGRRDRANNEAVRNARVAFARIASRRVTHTHGRKCKVVQRLGGAGYRGERKFLTSVMHAHNARIMNRRCAAIAPPAISHNLAAAFHVSRTSRRFAFVHLRHFRQSDRSTGKSGKGAPREIAEARIVNCFRYWG